MKIDATPIEGKLKKLKKKDAPLFNAVKNKILQIAGLDLQTIAHFKNLRAPLNGFKRVHVGSFVLFFKIEGGTAIFTEVLHHDEAYE